MIVAKIFIDASERNEPCHKKSPLSLTPTRAIPRLRRISAIVSKTIDRPTRVVPRAMTTGKDAGKRKRL